MWMQLIKNVLLTFLVGVLTLPVSAQNSDDSETKKETQINFLFNYYQQDGENSAVEGGRGSEELDNVAPAFIINVPLDTNKTLNVYTGVDFYTSASSDQVGRNVSGASGSDARVYLNATYSVENKTKRESYSFLGGFSAEYDYVSFSAGLGWTIGSRDGNREFGVTAKTYQDTWSLIYPTELRSGVELLNEDKRQSYSAAFTLSQVINKKLQISFAGDIVYQTGLLSTPFHRVFFEGATGFNEAQIEMLPDSRLKIPIGVRANYYLSDLFVLRSFYRYYMDDWGINSHTVEIEVPIKVSPYFTLYPFYRYYTQTEADYFAPFGKHISTDEFYTSDYDLSGFNSNKVGLGVRISPLYGVWRFKGPLSKRKKGRVTMLKSIDLRYAHYDRSTGLTADMITLDAAFTF